MSLEVSREEALEILLTLSEDEKSRIRANTGRLLDLGHSLESVLRLSIADVAASRRAKDSP